MQHLFAIAGRKAIVALLVTLVVTGCTASTQRPDAVQKSDAAPSTEDVRIIRGEQRFDYAHHTQRIHIDNRYGDVRVRMWDTPSLEVSAITQQFGALGRLPTLEPRQEQGVFHFRVDYPGAGPELRPGRVDLVVSVPRTVTLELESFDGLLQVRGTLSGVRARTVSGAIEVESSSDIDLSSVSGDISFRQSSGLFERVRVASDSGRIVAAVPVFADLDLSIEANRILADGGFPVAPGPPPWTHRFGAGGRSFSVRAPKGDVTLVPVVGDHQP